MDPKPEVKKGKKPVTTESSIAPMISGVPDINVSEFKNWFADLYDINKIRDEDLNSMYEILRYKGFNREEVLIQLFSKVMDKNIVIQLVLVTALQGPVRASKTKLSNGRTPVEMGIPASGQKGTRNLSCQRISAATADLAAYFLKKLNVPKRMNHPCPAYLQFPFAGSIKMPDQIRQYHRDYAAEFSRVIGGEFNSQIYESMVNNSYLSENLKLFD